MRAKKEMTNERLEVEVKRVEPASLATAELDRVAKTPFPVLRINVAGASPLVRRQANEMTAPAERQASFPRIRIKLDEGTIKVNSRTVRIAPGLSGRINGSELKKIANIYPRDLLFIRTNGGMQRVRDNQSLELVAGTEFRHEHPAPRFSSTSSLSRD